MKCRPEKTHLFELDYGELIRPPYRISLRPQGGGNALTKPTSISLSTAQTPRRAVDFRYITVCAATAQDNAGFVGLRGFPGAVR
jgi:hypothetical protein